MPVSIRPATKADAGAIAELNALVQSIHAEAHPEIFQLPDLKTLIADWGSDQAEDNSFSYLALLDGKPVGYVYVEVQRRSVSVYHRPHGMIYVHQICVAPEARGRGVGTALLDAAKQLGRDNGINRLALDVWRFNEPARRFFEAYGLETYNEKRWTRID